MFLTTINGINPRRASYRLRSESDILDKFLAGLEPWSLEARSLCESKSCAFSPEIEVADNGSAIVVKAELPGMKLENVNVDLTPEALTISGEKQIEATEEDRKGNHYYSERRSGAFQRVIPLSYEVDREKVDVLYKDGVLTVTLPKNVKAQEAAKKLKIRTE